MAVVAGRVITASELEFEARVLLIRAGGIEAATAPLERELLAKVLDAVIGERLVVAEADKLKAWRVDPQQLTEAVEAFRARFATRAELDAFLERSEMTPEELSAVLERGLRVQRALDGKLRLRAQVSEAQAIATQAERRELHGLPIAAVRQKLQDERLVALVNDELKALRKPGTVKLLGAFAPHRDGGF